MFFICCNVIYILYFPSFQFSTVYQDDVGSAGGSPENPVMAAIRNIRAAFPTLTIACDVCLCPYTAHGHCGVLHEGR